MKENEENKERDREQRLGSRKTRTTELAKLYNVFYF